jgi:predicted nucleotidyltransferase
MKVASYKSRGEVVYTEKHWRTLKAKRKRAKEVMSRLRFFGIDAIVYGSVARGDVHPSSDVDIFVPYLIPSYRLEIALEDFEVLERRIVQATPNYAIKGEFVLSDNTTVSFPLVKLKEKELDFYRFGGCVDYEQLLSDLRVAGVDKRLVLIIPTDFGHVEIPVNELQPSCVAKILGICLDLVGERIRVLERRKEIGRTGVFLCEIVPSFTSFEAYLMEIARENPMVRKRLNS